MGTTTSVITEILTSSVAMTVVPSGGGSGTGLSRVPPVRRYPGQRGSYEVLNFNRTKAISHVLVDVAPDHLRAHVLKHALSHTKSVLSKEIERNGSSLPQVATSLPAQHARIFQPPVASSTAPLLAMAHSSAQPDSETRAGYLQIDRADTTFG